MSNNLKEQGNNNNTNKQQKSRKIFLNNMNCWFSNFVIEELRNETSMDPKVVKNIFSGTMNNSEMKLPRLFDPNKISINYNFHYDSEVFNNDVFIYNTDECDLDELEYIVRGLRVHSNNEEKTLIIISNIMTWARTPLKESPTNDKDVMEPEEFSTYNNINNNNLFEEEKNNSFVKEKDLKVREDEKNDESVNKTLSEKADKIDKNNSHSKNASRMSKGNQISKGRRYYFHTDKDYNMRSPHPKFLQLKFLEDLALEYSSANAYYKVYIICPGFVYGCGEDFFFDLFKVSDFIHLYLNIYMN